MFRRIDDVCLVSIQHSPTVMTLMQCLAVCLSVHPKCSSFSHSYENKSCVISQTAIMMTCQGGGWKTYTSLSLNDFLSAEGDSESNSTEPSSTSTPGTTEDPGLYSSTTTECEDTNTESHVSSSRTTEGQSLSSSTTDYPELFSSTTNG